MLKLTAPLATLAGGSPVVYDITDRFSAISTNTNTFYSEPFDLPTGRYAIEVRVTIFGSPGTKYYFAIRLVDSAGNSVMGYAVPAHGSWLPEQATVFYPTITDPGAYRISVQASSKSSTYAYGRIERIRVIRLPPTPLVVGSQIGGQAYGPLRDWALSIGKTYETITEIPMPIEVAGPSLQSLFHGCSALTSIPDLDTSQVESMAALFFGCSSLVSVPAMDTSQVRNTYYMFYGCSSLVSVPALDTSQVTTTTSMFDGCSSLESVTLTGMGNGFNSNGTMDMSDTKLNAAAANALMESLGTPTPGGFLKLPSTAAGADTSIAEAKNWAVTVG